MGLSVGSMIINSIKESIWNICKPLVDTDNNNFSDLLTSALNNNVQPADNQLSLNNSSLSGNSTNERLLNILNNENKTKTSLPTGQIDIPLSAEVQKYTYVQNKIDSSMYNNKSAKLLSEADKLLGVPYVYGGNDINSGIDCSYFTQNVYKKLGFNLPRTTYDQINVGKSVSLNELKPGDLVFFETDKGVSGPDHVGIYKGSGRMIHASSRSGQVVDVDFNNYINAVSFYGAKRLI